MLRCLTLCVLLVLNCGFAGALFVDGCPIFGCRPSGSFSFYLNIPKDNATVNWISDIVLDPVPNVLGCVADSVNIVCQSNGPFDDDKGYVSLYGDNGTIRWKDKVLKLPTLPLLDNYGDVTGSDGNNLVHYDLFGKLYPIIKCYGLRPMFSMQLVSTMYLLLVSENGALVVRDTNAIPVATIYLNDTIQRSNGTFLPIAQPVVNGSRFYLLTEFVPEVDEYNPTVLNMQRLYAIDVHDRMVDIITVAWFFNFEMEYNRYENDELKYNKENERRHLATSIKRRDVVKNLKENVISKQNVIWDGTRSSVYVSLPPPYAYSNQPSTFWGFSDNGDSSNHLFRSYLDIDHMATFEADTYTSTSHAKDNTPTLWISTTDSMIHSVNPDGNISTTIDLQALLKASVTITSKLSLIQQNDTSEAYLILAFTVSDPTPQFAHTLRVFGVPPETTSLVLALATNTSSGRIQWMVPVPDNMEVKGQISGSAGAASRRKDQMVFYAESANKTAKIISIH